MFDGVGHGQYEVGEIRLHVGDLAGAEATFTMAYRARCGPPTRACLADVLARASPTRRPRPWSEASPAARTASQPRPDHEIPDPARPGRSGANPG